MTCEEASSQSPSSSSSSSAAAAAYYYYYYYYYYCCTAVQYRVFQAVLFSYPSNGTTLTRDRNCVYGFSTILFRVVP